MPAGGPGPATGPVTVPVTQLPLLAAAPALPRVFPGDMEAPEGGQGHITPPGGPQGGGTESHRTPICHCPPWGSQRGTRSHCTPKPHCPPWGTQSHHTPSMPPLLWGSQGWHGHTTLPSATMGVARGDITPPQHHHVPHSLRTSASPPWPPCPTGTKSTWRRSASLQKSSPRPSPAWSTLPKNCPCFQR